MESLVSMVHSLIVQLVWELPQKFSTDKDLGPDRFAALDRSESTLFEALRLLKDLLIIAPRTLHCVLDGAQLCEGDKEDVVGTGMYLNYFIDITQIMQGRKNYKGFVYHRRALAPPFAEA